MGDGQDEGAPKIARREFLKVGVVGAIGAATVGCPAESSLPLDAGLDDAGARDSGGGTDAPAVDAGADAAVAPVDPPEGTTENEADFPLGIACGDVTPVGAIVWAYYAGSAPLRLVVWEMDGATYARTAFEGDATLTEGFAHVDVPSLAGDAAFRYAFFETDGAGARTGRSSIGRFRTPPPDDSMAPVRLGAVSCVSNTRTIETIGHAGGREDLALFAFLGDTTYNDGSTSLSEYRGAWRSNLERPEFRALRSSTSLVASWDDHEFDNDYDPEALPAAQKAAAIRAFFDHQPLRRDATSPDRVWKRVRWGPVELFVLDCRNERVPSSRRTATAEYVSRAQMAWLKTALVESTATFKLILNSVPITDFPGAFDFASSDRWEGYAAQRTEILAHIDDQAITGVLWVAGDFHLASAQRVATSGPGSTQIEVLVGPGAQGGNVLAATLGAPQFDFATSDDNYAVIELDPASGEAIVQWVRGNGSILNTLRYVLT